MSGLLNVLGGYAALLPVRVRPGAGSGTDTIPIYCTGLTMKTGAAPAVVQGAGRGCGASAGFKGASGGYCKTIVAIIPAIGAKPSMEQWGRLEPRVSAWKGQEGFCDQFRNLCGSRHDECGWGCGAVSERAGVREVPIRWQSTNTEAMPRARGTGNGIAGPTAG